MSEEQKKWEKILKNLGLSVYKGDPVSTTHVGSTTDLERLDAQVFSGKKKKKFWDERMTPSQQESASSTDWDSRWLSEWNHLYD